MVSSDGISRSYQKQYRYDPAAGADIIILIDNKLDLIKDKVPVPDPTTWVNGYIKVFTCKSTIGANSLPETPIPDFFETDTPSQTLTKQKNVLWDNPAYRLVIYLADPVPANQPTVWVEKIFYNLQNNFGFPYTTEQLLDGLTLDIARDLPEGCKLGIAFEDIGWGLPKAQDKITFDIAWVAEYNWVKPFDINVQQPVVVETATVQNVTQRQDSYNIRLSSTLAQTILAANTNRLSGYIQNLSANTIYINTNGTASASSNVATIVGNGTWTIPSGNKNAVSVIANTGTQNSVTAVEVYNVTN